MSDTRGTLPILAIFLSDREQTRPTGYRPHNTITSIHILGDDSLLKIFYHCRVFQDEEHSGNDSDRTIVGGRKGRNKRWWYKLAHVCRKWRCLVLTSASHLGLRLICTHGTPVANMLAHSPPLPLIIDYGDEDRAVTEEDEEGMLLALRRRRRVHRIRLCVPTSTLRRLLVAIDGEFPMLEHLYVKPLTDDDDGLSLPGSFKAPSLRRCHFSLRNVTYSPGMFRPSPPAPSDPSPERTSQFALYRDRQLWKYVPFPCYVH